VLLIVLEFGSDDEESPQLIAQLQDIIAGVEVPEDAKESSGEEEEQNKEEEEGGDEQQQVVHSIFIGNLAASVSKDSLSTLVESVATPTQVRVLMQNRDGRQVAVAFVDFSSASAVTKAVKKLNNTQFEGKPLQVRPANDRKLAPAPAGGESVYVRNLSFNTTEETLKRLFTPFGEIIQIRLPVFADTGKHRGYGFIDYKRQESAKKALSLDRKQVDGRQILVEPAVKRTAPKAEHIKSEWVGERLTFDD